MIRKTKIAILGATSHIAKGLINNFLQCKEFRLHFYTRSSVRVCDFLKAMEKTAKHSYIIHEGYDDFMRLSYDVVINCVGVGTLNKPQSNYADYFTVNEKYDNLVIRYLHDYNPQALYICFSSGAVYGRNFTVPVEENSLNCIRVNHVAKKDYYTIVRLNSEAKHRAFKDLKIIDLRIFSYFSRFIDLTDDYFITDIIDCILKHKVLTVDERNIIRDYLHPQDLFTAVKCAINTAGVNGAFDITSAKPVAKQEILDYFVSEYNLKYEVKKSLNHHSPTGAKNVYCSTYNVAMNIGYKPLYSSMDTIKEETKHIIDSANKIK